MNNSNHTPLFTNQWRFVPLSILCVLAALIWYSFFNAPFSNLWLTFDERAYFILNDTLSDGGAWGKLVAYSNTKLYDAASAVILVGLLFVYAVLSKQTDFKHRLAAIIFAALYMAVTTFVRRELAIMEFDRESPSLVLEPFYSMRELYPAIESKIDSRNTFPGDHGIACLTLTGLFIALAGWRWGAFMFVFALPCFILPRLIGGAHWTSDVFAGSMACSLIIVAVAVFTPFAAKMSNTIENGLSKIWRFVPFVKK